MEMPTFIVRRQTLSMALWCRAGSTGSAGAPHTSRTRSAVCDSKRGKLAPVMGYFTASAVRRCTTDLSATATACRQEPSGLTSGRHAATAISVTASAPAKAPRRHGSCGGRRSAATARCSSSWCVLASWVMAASMHCQSGPMPPTVAAARPHAGSCRRNALQSRGAGVPSCAFPERMASKAATPAARGAPSAGDWRSSASSSSGATKGSKLLPWRCSPPA
mmetsp:Transcript_52017/g.166600  ORF Transcript_52017/g.166600 Transcript_52017/m.166600 type:complete len:220 (-) Transcript_52017:2220-2879(-)